MNDGLTTVKYNVSTIPHNFLIDRNGMIEDENIDLNRLEKEVKRLTTKD